MITENDRRFIPYGTEMSDSHTFQSMKHKSRVIKVKISLVKRENGCDQIIYYSSKMHSPAFT